MSQDYKTWVEVSKKALQNNARIVRGLLKPGVRLMAVVKSNAYGHGLVETAKLLSKNGDWLGVDNIDEAITLRKEDVKKPILILGYTPADRIKKSVVRDLRFTIYDAGILKQLASYKLNTDSYSLHLKFDTGMSRQGVTLADLPNFLKNLPKDTKFEGVFTHLANADNLTDRTFPNFQVEEFNKALGICQEHGIKPKLRHISATTGLLTMHKDGQLDMVRVGIAFYGLWPSLGFAQKFNSPSRGLGIIPALTWKTRIAQIKRIKKGSYVGYGITEKVKRDTTIAVLPVGYYDGYFRKLSSAAEVLIGGKRCNILGRISMNLSVADISKIKNPKVWDEVVLIGSQGLETIPAEELAEKAGTISYEVVSRINPLLPRTYL